MYIGKKLEIREKPIDGEVPAMPADEPVKSVGSFPGSTKKCLSLAAAADQTGGSRIQAAHGPNAVHSATVRSRSGCSLSAPRLEWVNGAAVIWIAVSAFGPFRERIVTGRDVFECAAGEFIRHACDYRSGFPSSASPVRCASALKLGFERLYRPYAAGE
jgi:hypothetical protein